MPTGLVLSDLHLLSERSAGDRLFPKLQPVLASAKLLVLNGDIFDFRWSTLGSAQNSLQAAQDWLGDLIQTHPHLEIHYLPGNHDCPPSFIKILESFAKKVPSFHHHPDQFQLGSLLFLHGDCTNLGMTREKLARCRQAWHHDTPCGPIRRFLYRLADRSGATFLFHKIYFPRHTTLKRLQRFLGDDLNGLTACYFGHTHRPFENHQLDEVTYFNTGSGIHGMGFLPQTFELDHSTLERERFEDCQQ